MFGGSYYGEDPYGMQVEYLRSFTGTCTITFTTTGELQDDVTLVGWDADESQRARIIFAAYGHLTKDTPAVAPPGLQIAHIWRNSQTFPAPVLNSKGRPADWRPTSVLREKWGRLQVVIDNTDVTFYRDTPTKVGSWSSGDPFDDALATVELPQITALETFPSWLKDWANVEIYLVRPNDTKKPLWEGLIAAIGDSNDNHDAGVTLTCVGPLFQMDMYLKQPSLVEPELKDVGEIIAKEFTDPRHSQLRTLPPNIVQTGYKVRNSGSWEHTLTGWIAKILGYCHDGASNVWTLMKDYPRAPRVRLRDRTTVHWTVYTGQPGVQHDLERDLTEAFNTYYGEGIDNDNCRWRNARFPNLRQDDAPVFDGNILTPGETAATMETFTRELYDRGWTQFTVDTFYHPGEETFVRQFQQEAGIQVDGDIGPQTWAAAFEVGSNGGDLEGAFIMPLRWDPLTERWSYAPDGSIAGDSPVYDRNVIRVERYENFGSRISKPEGVASTNNEYFRNYPAPYVGTITLAADPQEGHRYEIKGGENIKLKGHRGTDRLLHIAEAQVDFASGTVRLTVDERARDLISLGALLARERESTDPARRQHVGNRLSQQTEDRVGVWDCESGAGIIPRHATYAGLWNALRIPAGKSGSVVRAEFEVDTPARFAVGVFGRQVAANTLARGGSPLDAGFWDQFTYEEHGLVIAWGGDGEAFGYYPGLESAGDALTGKGTDASTWYFESLQPPWLWITIWVESPTVNYISGRLFPSNQP